MIRHWRTYINGVSNLSDRERLAVRPMGAFFPARSYGVVIRKGKYLSEPARAFLDLVKPGLLQGRAHDEPGHSER